MSASQQAWLRRKCQEIRTLPQNWTAEVGGRDTEHPDRIYFHNKETNRSGYYHSTLGALPKPWILVLYRHSQGDSVRYFNRETKESISQDPRGRLSKNESEPVEDLIDPSIELTPKEMHREDVGIENVRHRYDVLHTIDPGNGTLGAMNGGIFVVKLEDHQSLLIEKR